MTALHVAPPADDRFADDLLMEKALLGSLVVHARGGMDLVAGLLTPADFALPFHGVIFAAMVRVHERNEPTDPLLVSTEAGVTPEGDPFLYLIGCSTEMHGAAHPDAYARRVLEGSERRRLLALGAELIQRVQREPEGARLWLEAKLATLGTTSAQSGFVPVSEAVEEMREMLALLQDRDSAVTGLASGFLDLDTRYTSGFQPGNLIIVAGRPGQGKTSCALSIARHVALTLGSPVGIFSLEMARSELVQRLVAMESGVSFTALRSGKLWGNQQRVEEAMARIEAAPILIDDDGGLSIAEIRHRARALHARAKLALIAVDYLQLVSSPGENRVQEVGAVSRSLKAMAKELELPTLALAQLNRSVERRDDKRPMLSDMRESGSIEQDADLVLMLYRDAYYNPQSAFPNLAELAIAKNRNGPTGKVSLYFGAETMTFLDMAQGGTEERF
jgi:replicative DNA helicase